MSGLLENCWTNISMYSFSPIQGKRSWFMLKLGDRFVHFLFYFYFMIFPLKWRKMIHLNVGPTILPWHMGVKLENFQNYISMYGCSHLRFKQALPKLWALSFELLQSRRKDSNYCLNPMKRGSQTSSYEVFFLCAYLLVKLFILTV